MDFVMLTNDQKYYRLSICIQFSSIPPLCFLKQ